MQAVVKMFNLVIAQGMRKLLILKLNKKRLTYVAVFDLLVSAKTKRFLNRLGATSQLEPAS